MSDRGFVPPEKRQTGLTLRSYRLAADGTRCDDSGVIEVDPDDVSVHDYHPSATWPVCRCPQHGGRPKTPGLKAG